LRRARDDEQVRSRQRGLGAPRGAARIDQPAQEAVHGVGIGQAQRGLGAARLRRHQDADVAVAQADEHVLVGEIVAEREHRGAARAATAQPVERAALVRGAVADLERLDLGQPLELLVGLEPLVDQDLGGRGDRVVLCGGDPAPVQAHRARLALDQRAGVPAGELAQRVLDLVELRHRRERGLPDPVRAPPHAVLGGEHDAGEPRRQIVDEVARSPADDAERDPGRHGERREQRGGVVIDARLLGRGRERQQRTVEIERDDELAGRGQVLPVRMHRSTLGRVRRENALHEAWFTRLHT
jgi:hypothetical protein